VARTEQQEERLGFRDLGVPRSLLATSALGLAISAASAVLLLGGPTDAAIGASAASLAIAIACARLVKQRMRGSLREPVAALLRTLDQVRLGGSASELPEDGAPLLQPLLRRFHLAQAAMEQRSQKTVANLMHAEAAFDRVHAVLQSLREGVIVVDTKERIVLMNRNARRVLGLGERRAEAEPLFSLCTGALATAMRDGLARIDTQRAGEVRIGDIAHESRVYDLSVVQVQSNRPEQDYGKVLVLADVTQSHEVNRLKDELLSSISHELRTPLTNMICSSEILTTLTPSDEAEWREFADMLAKESKRLKSLVDDIMEYGLLETGRVEWNPEPQSLAELARTAAAVLRPAAQQKSQSIECAIGDDAIATVDPRRMREALCRMLDNAVKFSPEGGTIRIALTSHAGTAELSIEDDGPGIPAADRERVFERFQQLGDVLTEKPQGTGLGLAIVRRILEAAHGTVRCESSASGGARFLVSLPIATAAPR
jgi:signal transduction histidine kinase